MLTATLKTPYKNTAVNYLGPVDISDHQWLVRDRGENAVIICDKAIKLTDELVLFLHYFNATSDKNIRHTLKTFSNLPIREV